MQTFPGGTITFLLTEIAGTARLWEETPTAMQAALAHYHQLVAAAVAGAGGLVKTVGDGVHAAFPTALDGLLAAVAVQRAWSPSPPPTMSSRAGQGGCQSAWPSTSGAPPRARWTTTGRRGTGRCG